MVTAYQMQAGQGFGSLKQVERQRQALGHSQVRVAVRAVSLNYREVLISEGHYPAPTDRPIVPCSDGAGVITEVGSGVTHWTAGDRVVGSFFPGWHDGPPSPDAMRDSFGCSVDGWLAEEVVVEATALLKVPATVSFADAACTPCAGVTAWRSLFEAARLTTGQTVLVQGTGGVAMWAARLAHAAGIRTVLISSDDAKAAALGPVHAHINSTREPAWADSVLRATDGRGADLVVEVGGNATITQSLKAAAFGGHLALIGGLGGWTYENVDSLQFITKSLTAHGMFVGSAGSLGRLLEFMVEHDVQPHISARHAFEDAPAAFEQLRAARHVGKLLIDVA